MQHSTSTIPLLALLPLWMVGCDEIFAPAPDAEAGSDAGGSTPTPDTSGGGGSPSQDAGGSDPLPVPDGGGGGMTPDAGGGGMTPDTGGGGTRPVWPPRFQPVADRLQAPLATYCDKAVECGAFETPEACEDDYLGFLMEQLDVDRIGSGCVSALGSFFECYVRRLTCSTNSRGEPYAESLAGCDLPGARVYSACPFLD